MAMTTDTGEHKYTNRLSKDSSPYLLQHAHNPVDWYAWGPEAFEKAKKENKPIFLSVGYSTCRWCHVMARECFESEQVAKIMNDVCVNIKVDLEVLPDVDRIYMMFVQATTGSGGWPMSVFLTPDLKPFFGGTYFPPGALLSIFEQIDDKWKANPSSILETSEKLHAVLSSHLSLFPPSDGFPRVKPLFDQAVGAYSKRFDHEHGGFGGAPKFPTVPMLTSLQVREALVGEPSVREMLDVTFTKMARGGIHDHVGSGFHRYSVDERWHVPHFEKMLYDQGQLMLAYLREYTLTKNRVYLDTALDIVKYSTRDLYSPYHKAFFAAEDAESLPTFESKKKKEGAYWVWDYAEVKRILSGDTLVFDAFTDHFGIKEEGNVDPRHDPHGEMEGKNILMEQSSLPDTLSLLRVKHPELTLAELTSAIEKGKHMLFEERSKRPKPHRDDKIVAAWNGMVGRALSWIGRVLVEEGEQGEGARLVVMAEELAEFLLGNKMRFEDGRIRRVFGSDVEGVVDDYAHTISFLLALYQARFEPVWLREAIRLQAKQDELFWDQDKWGYFAGSKSGVEDGTRIMRLKDDQDGAEPSANSTSLNNLITLDAVLHATSPSLLGLSDVEFVNQFEDKAQKLLGYFSGMLGNHPTALPEMLSSAFLREIGLKTVIFAGEAEPGKGFVREVRKGEWAPDVIYVKELTEGGEEASGRMCFGGTCGLKKVKAEQVRQEVEEARRRGKVDV